MKTIRQFLFYLFFVGLIFMLVFDLFIVVEQRMNETIHFYYRFFLIAVAFCWLLTIVFGSIHNKSLKHDGSEK